MYKGSHLSFESFEVGVNVVKEIGIERQETSSISTDFFLNTKTLDVKAIPKNAKVPCKNKNSYLTVLNIQLLVPRLHPFRITLPLKYVFIKIFIEPTINNRDFKKY